MFSGRRLLLLLIHSSSLAAAHAGLSFQRESCGAEYWIYGHSHRNINDVIGKTQCVSNQLGYVFSGEHRNISVPEPAESK